ncbi:MAG: hypothetical protein KIT19_05600 [Phycisphaeraceae bacterium]|nr:hypothetical protein [Phycisphaeraceae bacterium]
MKLKGINPIEQHVEKLVLAGASAVALLVIAMQFTTQPNMVQPDSKGRKLPPAKAFEPAETAATQLTAQLRTKPTLPEPPALTLLSEFKAASERPLIQTDARIALGVPAKIGGGVIAPASDGRYAAVVVPAPVSPIAAVFEGAIDPSTVVQYPELKSRELVPMEQPYDKASVSVEATFSGTALRAALEADPDGEAGELRPIPIQWWRDGVEILGVQLERAQLRGDGTWGEPVLVGSLPGRVDLVSELAGASRVTVSLLRSAIEQARIAPESVQRPEYFAYIAGEEWIPPSDAVRRQVLDERRAKVERVTQQIEELDARLAALESELASAPTSLTQAQPQTETGGGGGGGAGGKGPGGGGGGRDPGRTTSQPEPRRMTKAQVQRQIDLVKRDRDAKQAELVALGGEPTDMSGLASGGAQRSGLLPTLFETPSLKVWGHDITVSRGESYRYRLRVVVNNPAFGNALSLSEDQRGLAESPTLSSAWTEWTAPVSVDPVRTYFVTNASVSDAVGGMRATASVYEFYYGFWRVGNASLTPGDPIEARLRLPSPDLMPIFDESTLAAAPAQRPGFRETEIVAPGGGKGGPIGGGPASESSQPAQPQLPLNSRPGPRERSVSIDSVYLSTATMPVTGDTTPLGVAAGARYLVYLREVQGQVIARLPDTERGSEVFRRMERSAKLGERQGMPVPKPEQPKPVQQPRERPGTVREPTGGGGGGGG